MIPYNKLYKYEGKAVRLHIKGKEPMDALVFNVSVDAVSVLTIYYTIEFGHMMHLNPAEYGKSYKIFEMD